MKKYNEEQMVQDLYKLYHQIIAKEVHYKIGTAAVDAAKAIAMHRNLQIKLKALANKTKSK